MACPDNLLTLRGFLRKSRWGQLQDAAENGQVPKLSSEQQPPWDAEALGEEAPLSTRLSALGQAADTRAKGNPSDYWLCVSVRLCPSSAASTPRPRGKRNAVHHARNYSG
ncbi:UNVERIFIED_CONTAM: hypothetical protein K2H54_004976 [Gekko kuhli]